MNTTEKGNNFENRVYDLFCTLISEGKFWTDKKSCNIFKKKAYYSPNRQSNIITDISIEIFLPNTTEYSLLCIIECKDYGKTVSIDNIEEFSSKLMQLSAHKGIMVTTSSFPESGINFAKSKGIGLMRLSDDNNISIDVYRKEMFGLKRNLRYEIFQKFIALDSLKGGDIIQTYNDVMFNDTLAFFKYFGLIDKTLPNKLEIPYLSHDALENIAEKIINQYASEVFVEFQMTPLEKLCEGLKKDKNVSFIFDEFMTLVDGSNILGKIVFSPLTIYISSYLGNDQNRKRFTLAHEISHLILHADKLSEYNNSIIDTNLELETIIKDKTTARIEIQANYLASCLLMPKASFEPYVKVYFFNNNIKNGKLRLDEQRCNIDEYYKLAESISTIYKVSYQAVKYRLIALDLLYEVNPSQSIRRLISNK